MANPGSALVVPTSIYHKMINLLAAPGEVFGEVVVTKPTAVNWRLPTLLVCLAGIIGLGIMSDPQIAASQVQAANGIGGGIVDWHLLAGTWLVVSSLMICLGAFGGMLWSAAVLWIIGRWFLGARFSFGKTVEVAALSSVVLILGTVMTGLLISVTGDLNTRPALSLLTDAEPGSRVRLVLEALNVFHIWAAMVLAAGLSKLSGAAFKDCAFWVFGYWIVMRVGVILLS